MRTTINMPDRLLAQAKKAALEADITLTELIANAVRQALALKHARPARPAAAMPVYAPSAGEDGLQPGVDLDDTAALLDLMDSTDAALRR